MDRMYLYSPSFTETAVIAGVGICAVSIALIALWHKSNQEAEKIVSEATGTASAVRNSISAYLNKVRGDYPSTAIEWPKREDLCVYADEGLAATRHVSNADPLCQELYRLHLQLEAITIYLIRQGCCLHGRATGFAFVSPFDLWFSSLRLIRSKTTDDKATLLQKNIKDSKMAVELESYIQDYNYLIEILMQEGTGMIKRMAECAKLDIDYTCTITPDIQRMFDEFKNSDIQVKFIRELADIDSPPMINASERMSQEFLLDSVFRATITTTVDNFVKEHIKDDDDNSVRSAHELYCRLQKVLKSGQTITQMEEGVLNELKKYVGA